MSSRNALPRVTTLRPLLPTTSQKLLGFAPTHFFLQPSRAKLLQNASQVKTFSSPLNDGFCVRKVPTKRTSYSFQLSFLLIRGVCVLTGISCGIQECCRSKLVLSFKTDSIRKLSNFNFQWGKALYQHNLKNIAFFFTFFKG